MKKLVIILVILLLFTGCTSGDGDNGLVDKYLFNTPESNLFPFYAVDNENVLWRVENDGAYSLKVKVNEKSYIRYLKSEDTIIFTTSHYEKNGITFCNLMLKTADNKIENIFEKVRLDSIRVQNDGNLLFLDETDTLYFRRDGIISRIEGDVAQCEFVSEDTFLFRLKKGLQEGKETVYPIYYANFDYRNFLMNGLEIIATDSENGKAYIIKNKHTVQKRTSAKEVADCYVYADGEILFSIPSTLLSQFEENEHMFLIAVNEDATTFKYNLFRVDGAELILKCENIISGRYVSKNVFAYEVQTAQDVKTSIVDRTDEVYTYTLGEKCSLESIYHIAPYTFVLKEDELILLEKNGLGAMIDDGIKSITVTDSALICFKENLSPYTISVCAGTVVTNKVSEVINKNVLYKDGLLYYYTGEGDLNMASREGTRTALISNVDTSVDFIAKDGTVAVVKKDTGTLFIASGNGIADTELKIKRIIKE